MDANNVFGDRFHVCRITSISYRIYTLKPPDVGTQVEESEVSLQLRWAEVKLRKQTRRSFHLSLTPSGRELWIYNLKTTDIAELDPLQFDELDQIADTTAQGVFLPPFTASVPSEHDGRYGPLLRAIELSFMDRVIQSGEESQYEAFGTTAVLCTGDGSIIRFTPSLYQHGSLVMRVTMQRCLLAPLPLNSLQLCAPVVYLLPHGKPCRVLSSLPYEQVVEPANAIRARKLYALLNKTFVFNTTLADLEESMWLRVSTTDAGDLLWPVTLIRACPLITSVANTTPIAGQAQNRLHSHLNLQVTYPARRPLILLAREAPYKVLADEMANVRKATDVGPEDHQQFDTDLHRTLNRPMAPPPSPRLHPPSSRASTVDLLQSGGTNSITNFVAGSNHHADLVHNSDLSRNVSTAHSTNMVGSNVNSSVSNTVGLYNSHVNPTSGLSQVYPTPTYQTPVYHASGYPTPSGATPSLAPENWAEDDDMAVGDADFNFFDLPLNNEHSGETEMQDLTSMQVPPMPNGDLLNRAQESISLGPLNSSESFSSLKSPGLSQVTPNVTQLQSHESECTTNESDVKPRHSQDGALSTKFGVLDLGGPQLDHKYVKGGRFFVSKLPSEENFTERSISPLKLCYRDPVKHSESIDNDDASNMTDGYSMKISQSEISSCESESDDDSVMMHDGSEFNEFDNPCFEAPPLPVSDDFENAWMQSIKHEHTTFLPVDNSKFLVFRQLLSQIVWDGGLLSEVYDIPVVNGETEVAPKYIIERLGGSITQLSIGLDQKYDEASQQQSTGQNIPPKSEFPNNAVSSKTQPPNLNLHDNNIGGNNNLTPKNKNKLQLLSPPLVAVKRGNQNLRARISILRFWNALNLSPPTSNEPASLTVVMLTLDSPTIAAGARMFLKELQTAFSGCSLGTLNLPTFGDITDGLMLIHADLGHTSGDAVGVLYQAACSELKLQVQQHLKNVENLLLIICYPPSSLRGGTLTAVVPFEIAQGVSTIRNSIPEMRWLLCSLDTLVSRWDHAHELTLSSMHNLAMLAYTRFPHLPQPFRLAGLAPQSSGLQFNAELPQILMEDENFLHIAYLIVEGRWCLTSWSDQWARKVAVDIYRLNDGSTRSIQNVFHEIWQNSVKLAAEIKDRPGWRFGITKCGMMSVSELSVWKKVLPNGNVALLMDMPHVRGVRVTDCRPIREKAANFPVNSTSASGKIPADGVVVDKADEIYGISIEAPAPGVGRFAAALARGYLVRPDVEGHIALETRLLFIHGLTVQPRNAMSRVIGHFRRLASLNEFTGVTTQCTLVPWHIMGLSKLEAAALKLNML